MQLQAYNFKLKEANKVTYDYFFKPVDFYYNRNIKIAQFLVLKKREN